jgi:WD40 repeat protein
MRKLIHTSVAIACLVTGFSVCKSFSLLDSSREGTFDNGDGAAAQLAARAQLLQSTDPAALEISALLAIESLKRAPSPDADHTLRSAMTLLRSPFKRVPHGKEIYATALSSDGQVLATASDDNTLRLVAVNSDEILPSHDHKYRIYQIASSPDEQLVATAGNRMVQVFDFHNSAPIQSLVLESDIVSLAFGSNGRLAIGSRDNVVQVVEARTGKPLVRFSVKEQIRMVVLDSAAKTLAVAAGSFVHLYDIAAKKEVPYSPLKHDGTVRVIAFGKHTDSVQPFGALLATASEDGTARVFRIPSGTLIAKWSPNGNVPLTLITFAQNDRLLATAGTDNTARVFRITSECKELSSFHHNGAITFLAFAMEDAAVITTSLDHTARIFRSNSGHEIARMVQPGPVLSASFHNASGTIATGSLGLARLFHATMREPGTTTLSSMMSVARSMFSHDGALLVATAKEIHQFSAAGGEIGRPITLEYPLNALDFSNDGQLMAVSTVSGITYLYKDGVPRVIANSGSEGRQPVSALALSPDQTVIALAGPSTNSSGQEQSYVRLLDTATGTEVRTTQTCEGIVKSIAVSSTHAIAVGTSDRICVFQAHSKYVPLTHQVITAIAFSPTGDVIAAGTQRGSAQAFDMNGKEVFSSYQHGDVITSILFMDGRKFATLTAAGVIRVFALQEQQLLTWLPQAAKAFRPVRGSLLTLSQDDDGLFLHMYAIESTALIERACSMLSRNLLEAEWHTHVGFARYQKTCRNLP